MLTALYRLQDKIMIKTLISVFLFSSCNGNINKKADAINTNKILSLSNDSLIFQKRWTDKLGENVFKIKKHINYEANEGENIFKLSVSLQNSSGSISIKDSVQDCPVETDLNFIVKSFELTDIDNNGFKEVSFLYNKYCRGDISGDDLLLFCIENNNKWFIKGFRTNKAFEQSDYYDGFGEVTNRNIPEKFKKEMLKKWLKYSNENLIHRDIIVSKKYVLLSRKEKLNFKYSNLSKTQHISKKMARKLPLFRRRRNDSRRRLDRALHRI